MDTTETTAKEPESYRVRIPLMASVGLGLLPGAEVKGVTLEGEIPVLIVSGKEPAQGMELARVLHFGTYQAENVFADLAEAARELVRRHGEAVKDQPPGAIAQDLGTLLSGCIVLDSGLCELGRVTTTDPVKGDWIVYHRPE